MKKVWGILLPLIGIGIGLMFYMAYIHAVSWLAIPIGLAVVIGVIGIFSLAAGNLLVNIKDFIVSIFKDDDEKDNKGFKKHF